MRKLMDEDALLSQNDHRICVVLTPEGMSLTDDGYKGCVKMMNDCFPDGKNEHNLFLTGKDMNNIPRLSGILKKRPDAYLVISQGDGLRLIPSGSEYTPLLAQVCDEAMGQDMYQSSWDLFNDFLKTMDEDRKEQQSEQ